MERFQTVPYLVMNWKPVFAVFVILVQAQRDTGIQKEKYWIPDRSQE